MSGEDCFYTIGLRYGKRFMLPYRVEILPVDDLLAPGIEHLNKFKHSQNNRYQHADDDPEYLRGAEVATSNHQESRPCKYDTKDNEQYKLDEECVPGPVVELGNDCAPEDG